MEIRVSGMMDEYKEIYAMLLKCRKKTYYLGYMTDDMPYHGYSGDKVKEADNILNETNKRLDELIGFCQCVMNLPPNDSEWKDV